MFKAWRCHSFFYTVQVQYIDWCSACLRRFYLDKFKAIFKALVTNCIVVTTSVDHIFFSRQCYIEAKASSLSWFNYNKYLDDYQIGWDSITAYIFHCWINMSDTPKFTTFIFTTDIKKDRENIQMIYSQYIHTSNNIFCKTCSKPHG